MKKWTTIFLSAVMLSSLSNVAVAEEVGNDSISPTILSSELKDGISIQADRQQAVVRKQTYQPYGPYYSDAVSGRNRTGHFTLTYEYGGSDTEVIVLEYNGSNWKQVDRLSTNVTLTPTVSGSYYMKNGYAYKLKLMTYTNDAAVARIENY